MEEHLFKDNFEYFMPPSVRDMTGDQVVWLRPKEYLFELALENETKRVKTENRNLIKKYKASKKLRTSSVSVHSYNSDKEEEIKKKKV